MLLKFILVERHLEVPGNINLDPQKLVVGYFEAQAAASSQIHTALLVHQIETGKVFTQAESQVLLERREDARWRLPVKVYYAQQED